MEVTRAKLASLVVAAIEVLVAAMVFNVAIAYLCGVMLLGPLALIWFDEELGSFTGYAGRGPRIDLESPAWAVAGLGWIALVGAPFLLAYLWRA